MAHDIFMNRAMYYAGETPWHGLGTKLPANATWEQVADIFPDVREMPLGVLGAGTLAPDVKALMACDDGRYLATVGADYCVVQARDVAKAVVTAAGGVEAIFHTAGVLGDRGQRGFLLGEMPGTFRVDGDDSEIRRYFLASFGHDGRSAINLANVSTRVVCRNTVSAALAERGNWRETIRHTSGASLRVEDASRSFAAIAMGNVKLAAFAQHAGTVRTTRESIMASLDAFLPAAEKETDKSKERREAAQAKVVELLQGPTVGINHRGTAWGLLCAMSEFGEHYKPVRLPDESSELSERSKAWTAHLAERSLFGAGLEPVTAAYVAVSKTLGLELPR